jgi:metal-responsive CopG/Arc/MetJ family transcriptional regulator
MTKQAKMPTCCVQLPRELWAEIGRQAELAETSRSEIVRRLIARALDLEK